MGWALDNVAFALRSSPVSPKPLVRPACQQSVTGPEAVKASRSALPSRGHVALSLAVVAGLCRPKRRSRLQQRLVRNANQSQEAPVDEAEKEVVPFFEEVSGDDPIVLELEDRLRKMNGDSSLTLDMVLNPGTIVNAEREVILLRAELKATPDEELEKRKELEDKIEAKQMKIVNEMRQVMTDSLKLEFLLQAALSVPLFGAMCYDALPIPDLNWLGLDDAGSRLVLRLFGLWGIWLVTVPALRARKPGGPYGMGYEEKRALDLSFLILPLVCILVPFISKDPALIFWLCLLTVGGCYVWSFKTPLETESTFSRRGAGSDLNLPEPIMWALKALDFGTGSERGAVREDTTWQEQLEAYEKAAEELAAKKLKQKA